MSDLPLSDPTGMTQGVGIQPGTPAHVFDLDPPGTETRSSDFDLFAEETIEYRFQDGISPCDNTLSTLGTIACGTSEGTFSCWYCVLGCGNGGSESC